MICVTCRVELPTADRLRGPFLESVANAAHDANVRGFPVYANQNAQRYGPLDFHVACFVRIHRIRTNDARRERNSVGIGRPAFAASSAWTFMVSHSTVFTSADAPISAWPRRIRRRGHPRQAQIVLWQDYGGGLHVQNRRNDREQVICPVWQPRRRKLYRRSRCEKPVRSGAGSVFAAARRRPERGIARELIAWCGVQQGLHPDSGVRHVFSQLRRIGPDRQQRGNNSYVRDERKGLRALGTFRSAELQQVNGRAIRG